MYLAALLLWAGTLGSPCEDSLTPAFFTAEDFPHSPFGLTYKTERSQFPAWAAEQANKTLQLLKRDVPIETIFDELREARYQFELQSTLVSDAEPYRHYRWQGGGDTSSVEFYRAVFDREMLQAVIDPRKTFEHPHVRANFWALRQLGAVTGEFNEMLVSEAFSDPVVVGRLFLSGTASATTVELRMKAMAPHREEVEWLYRKLLSELSSAGSFAHDDSTLFALAQAYFWMQPFRRGSAAIGRILFTAYFSHHLGRKVQLDSEIDILAMVMDRKTFAKHALRSQTPEHAARSR